MTDNTNKQPMEVIKQSLVSIGFTIDEAEKQISEVGKIVTMAIMERLLKEKAEVKDLTVDNLEKFLKENFTSSYLKQVVDIESARIVDDYLKTITQNLSQDKKQSFFDKMRAAVQ